MENSENKKRIPLSRGYRCFLYFIFVSIEGIMNVSAGLMSSASNEIKKQLNIKEVEFGSFSLSTSIGRVFSSLLFSAFNKTISRKWSTIGSMIIHATSLCGFYLSSNKYILFFLRGVQGFSQMPPSIYVPVWINQFGLKNFKTLQMTSIQLFATLGVFCGYLINLIIGKDNWKYGFLFEASYMLFCIICFTLTKEIYFSNDLFSISNIDNGKNEKTSIFEKTENLSEKSTKKVNFLNDLKKLIVHNLFMISMFCRVIIHGLNTCLLYWLADFLRNAIGEKNDIKITFCNLVICLAGPFGGLITNTLLKKIIGSYESRKSSWPLVILQICASITAVCIGIMPTTYTTTGCIIFFFFFNSSALPLLQGILISCVDKDLSTTGFALANVMTQILTSGTITALYGKINDKYKSENKRVAMCVCMSFHFIAVPLLIALAILRNKKLDEEAKKKEDKEQELVEKNEENS